MFTQTFLPVFRLRKKPITREILFTLGYEGLRLEEFINRLKEKGIEVLIDVREIPLSRKRGFSKSQLDTIVNQNGIKYIHMKKLGSPSIIRHKVKEDGNYKEFFKAYINYIKTQIEELKNLERLVEKSTCCLMCYEKDIENCHRKVIASEIKKINNNGLKVVNL